MSADPPRSGPPRGSNVLLIGSRGSGKSTVGAALAHRLSWSFVDTDVDIETRLGLSVREIFERLGQPAFRQAESEALERAAAADRTVFSTGGGVVLSAENRRRLRRAGLCVWLRADADELHRRTARDPRSAALRPQLTDLDPLDETRHVLERRAPLYESVADASFDTNGRSIERIVSDVFEWVSARIVAERAP